MCTIFKPLIVCPVCRQTIEKGDRDARATIFIKCDSCKKRASCEKQEAKK